MTKYEYKAVSADDNATEIKQLGLQGWEMVAVDDSVIYFKRPIIDKTPIDAD